jgi:site-specific DNA-methyltransferase (adenine-specific)
MIDLPTDDDPVEVVCGDALNVLADVPDGWADLVLTDPPYSSGGMYRSDRSKDTDDKYQHKAETNRTYAAFSGDNRDQRSFERWCYQWMSESLRATREGGAFGCFIDWRNLACVIDSIQVAGWVFRGVTPWHKGTDQRPRKGWFRANVEFIVWGSSGSLLTGHTAPGLCQDGVFYQRVNGIEKEHQTQKPVDLFRDILRTRPDWLNVLDPFAGSGTTGVAAQREGRRALLIEKEESYTDIIRRRLSEAGTLFAEAAK